MPRLPRRLPPVLRLAAAVVGVFVCAAVLNLGYAAVAQEDGVSPDIDEEDLNDPELIRRGRDIYGQACALCHGEAGRGVPREAAPEAFGPPLVDVGAASVDFMLRTGRMPLDNANARLRHSEQHVSDSERRALVAYITSLGDDGKGPAIPDITGYQNADLGLGLELYTSNCAACHGPTGAGIAVGQEDVSSNLDIATPLEVAEAIRTGPGVMPVFGEDVLPQEELEAVVHWVVDLRQREAPGGLQFGRSGPVWEGLLAWVLGMGALTVVMYLLGEKATEDEDDAEPNA